MANGIIVPGKIHTLVRTGKPYNQNKYYKIGTVFIDNNFRDISDDLLRIFNEQKEIHYFSVDENEIITGNSYEMLLILLLKGYTNINATGTISYTSGTVKFGPVGGMNVKTEMLNNLLTYKDIHELIL